MVLKEHGGPLTDKQKKMLQEAERSCERISAVVAELSELGKLESHELAVSQQELDLAMLLHEVASDMHEGDDRTDSLAGSFGFLQHFFLLVGQRAAMLLEHHTEIPAHDGDGCTKLMHRKRDGSGKTVGFDCRLRVASHYHVSRRG